MGILDGSRAVIYDAGFERRIGACHQKQVDRLDAADGRRIAKRHPVVSRSTCWDCLDQLG